MRGHPGKRGVDSGVVSSSRPLPHPPHLLPPASKSTTDKLELHGSFVRGDETALHVRAAMRSGSHYLDLDTYDVKAARL